MTDTPTPVQTAPTSISLRPVFNSRGTPPGPRFGHSAGIVRYPRSRRDDASESNGARKDENMDEEVVEMIVLFGSDEGLCHDVYSYDLRSQEWSRLKVQIVNIHEQISDLDEDEWAQRLCCSNAASAVVGEDIFMFGGVRGPSRKDHVSNHLLRFNAPQRILYVVDVLNKLPEPAVGASLTFLPAGEDTGPRLFLFGGLESCGETSADCHLYHIEERQWEAVQYKGDPPSPRDSHSAVYWRGMSGQERKLVFFGGMSGDWRKAPDYGRLPDVVVLDLGRKVWSRPAISGIPPQRRSLHAACLIGNTMVIFGGMGVKTDPQLDDSLYEKYSFEAAARAAGTQVYETLKDMHFLDLLTWTWIEHGGSAEVVMSARSHFTASMIDNTIYYFGGLAGFKERVPIGLNDIWRLDVEPPLPAGPLNVDATNNLIAARWTDPHSWDPFRTYRLYLRREHEAGDGFMVYEGKHMECDVSTYPAQSGETRDLQPDEEYVLRLVAFNGVAESPCKDENVFCVLPKILHPPRAITSMILPFTPSEFADDDAMDISGASGPSLMIEWQDDTPRDATFQVDATCRVLAKRAVKDAGEVVIKRRKTDDNNMVVSVNNSPQTPYDPKTSYTNAIEDDTTQEETYLEEEGGAGKWHTIWQGGRRVGISMSEIHQKVTVLEVIRRGLQVEWKDACRSKRKRDGAETTYAVEYRFRVRATIGDVRSDWCESKQGQRWEVRPDDVVKVEHEPTPESTLPIFVYQSPLTDVNRESVEAPPYSPVASSPAKPGDVSMEGIDFENPVKMFVLAAGKGEQRSATTSTFGSGSPPSLSGSDVDVEHVGEDEEDLEEEEEVMGAGTVVPAENRTPKLNIKAASSADGARRGSVPHAKTSGKKLQTPQGKGKGSATKRDKGRAVGKEPVPMDDFPATSSGRLKKRTSLYSPASAYVDPDVWNMSSTPTKPKPKQQTHRIEYSSTPEAEPVPQKKERRESSVTVKTAESPTETPAPTHPVVVRKRDANGRPVLGGEDNSFHFNLPYGTRIQVISPSQPTEVFYAARVMWYLANGSEWGLRICYDGWSGSSALETLPLKEDGSLHMEPFTGKNVDEKSLEKEAKKPRQWDSGKPGPYLVTAKNREAAMSGKCAVHSSANGSKTAWVYGTGDGEYHFR